MCEIEPILADPYAVLHGESEPEGRAKPGKAKGWGDSFIEHLVFLTVLLHYDTTRPCRYQSRRLFLPKRSSKKALATRMLARADLEKTLLIDRQSRCEPKTQRWLKKSHVKD